MKLKPFFIGILLVALLAGGGLLYVLMRPSSALHPANSADTTTDQSGANPKPTPNPSGFNKNQYSLTEPTSIWIVVNKQHPIPVTYAPNDLIVPAVPLRLAAGAEQMHIRKIAQKQFEALMVAAKADGANLKLSSGYRSATYQKSLYDSYVSAQGKAAADTFSARPGYSEHQTGLAIDFMSTNGTCTLQECFANTPEGKWLAKHAVDFGFILRYTKSKQTVTGYKSEPWHYRYVGIPLAKEMKRTGITTLEEFFGLGAAPDY